MTCWNESHDILSPYTTLEQWLGILLNIDLGGKWLTKQFKTRTFFKPAARSLKAPAKPKVSLRSPPGQRGTSPAVKAKAKAKAKSHTKPKGKSKSKPRRRGSVKFEEPEEEDDDDEEWVVSTYPICYLDGSWKQILWTWETHKHGTWGTVLLNIVAPKFSGLENLRKNVAHVSAGKQVRASGEMCCTLQERCLQMTSKLWTVKSQTMVMGSVCPGGAVDPELGLQRGIDNQGGHGLTGISSGDMGLRVRFYIVSKSSFSILQMEVPTLLL